MRRSSSIILCAFAVALFLPGSPKHTWLPSFGSAVSLAQAAEWRTEYESICAKTDIAMTLSEEELKGLIAQCDRLKPWIEAEEESTRKVYLRRLTRCRDLYDYVLENKSRK